MANEILKRDQNRITVLAGITDDSDQEIRMLRVDSSTNRLLVSSSGGGGFTELAATGTVDGSNTSFTFTEEPTYVVSDHAWYKATNKSGTTNWTWNGLDTVTMTIPPQEDIFGVA